MSLRLYVVTVREPGGWRCRPALRTIQVHARHTDDAVAAACRVMGTSRLRLVSIRPGHEPDGMGLGAKPTKPKPTRWGRAFPRREELRPPAELRVAAAA